MGRADAANGEFADVCRRAPEAGAGSGMPEAQKAARLR